MADLFRNELKVREFRKKIRYISSSTEDTEKKVPGKGSTSDAPRGREKLLPRAPSEGGAIGEGFWRGFHEPLFPEKIWG